MPSVTGTVAFNTIAVALPPTAAALSAPADAGADNSYSVFFTASDGANTVMQNVAITVSNIAPGFRVRRIASGLPGPIFVSGLPDGSGRIAIVHRTGLIRTSL